MEAPLCSYIHTYMYQHRIAKNVQTKREECSSHHQVNRK